MESVLTLIPNRAICSLGKWLGCISPESIRREKKDCGTPVENRIVLSQDLLTAIGILNTLTSNRSATSTVNQIPVHRINYQPPTLA